MKGQRIGYIRVSAYDQNPERQLEGIDLDRTFTDQASGKNAQRLQLEELMSFARSDDVVYVHSMDRLARNLDDLRQIVQALTGRGVEVHFIKVGRFAATFCPVQPSNLWEIPVIFFCLSLLTLIPRTAKDRAIKSLIFHVLLFASFVCLAESQ
ncbi:MAG: recombinase family protein, partial [Endozoicomonas sp.]|uniref:recombinase family protein n=1 Tax=Endozoicomonas sp. TaxID=1892382 RepID=UPI003D9B9368